MERNKNLAVGQQKNILATCLSSTPQKYFKNFIQQISTIYREQSSSAQIKKTIRNASNNKISTSQSFRDFLKTKSSQRVDLIKNLKKDQISQFKVQQLELIKKPQKVGVLTLNFRISGIEKRIQIKGLSKNMVTKILQQINLQKQCEQE